MSGIGDARYVSLVTFRRSGEPVATPVWIASDPDDDRLYVYTNRQSWKVKRLRRDPRVQLAPCTASGRVTGEAVTGHARVVEDPTESARGFEAVIRKYGWMMCAALLASRLSGRYADRAILEIRLGGERDSSG